MTVDQLYQRVMRRKYYEKYREKELAYRREYYRAHRETILAKKRMKHGM